MRNGRPTFKNPRVKSSTPTVNFTMIKKYLVYPPAMSVSAPQIPAGIMIDATTPFSPINFLGSGPPASIAGTWDDEDPTFQQPFGIDSDLYSGYKHLVVNYSSVTVSLTDNPDAPVLVTPVSGNDITEGTISLARTTDNDVYTYGTQFAACQEIRDSYGAKQSKFRLGSQFAQPRGSSLRLGYSARRQFGTSARGTSGRFWVDNTPGSYTTCNDATYFNIFISCNDLIENHNLQPCKVSLKLTYNVTFLEPTISQSIPLPVSLKPKKSKTKYKKTARKPGPVEKALWRQLTNMAIRNAPGIVAGGTGLMLGGPPAYNRYRRLRG